MGWTSNLLGGLAAHLDAQAVAVYRGDGSAYLAGETAIAVDAQPQAPDRVLTLGIYPLGEQDGIGDVTVGLQVRARGGTDPRDVMDLADAARGALDGLRSMDLGGVWVSQIYHQSGAQLPGRDKADRHERTDNYYIQARRETALRSD